MRIVRPDRELASSIVSVHEAAKHFSVDVVTIRRWLVAGCPCVRPGHRGPGRGALVDLEQVALWRGNSSVVCEAPVEEIMQRIASALYGALTDRHVDIGAGIDRASCAAVLVAAFDECRRTFGKTYRFEQLPAEIQTLMSEL